MQAIDINRTVDVGMKRTFSSKMDNPFTTISLMVSIPSALIDEPPMPVTILSAIGCSVAKDVCGTRAIEKEGG